MKEVNPNKNMGKLINDSRNQIFLIVFFSAIFRLFFMDLIEFKYDEGLSVFQTFLFYQQPFIPQTGLIASTGMYNFPLFNYLLIIIGLFSQDPRYLSFIIALINVISIVVFYLLTKKIFGGAIAFISSLTLSISPWAIIFSRKIWAQDLILIFAVPIFYYLQKIMKNESINIIKLGFLLFLLIQLHASGIFLTAALIILIFALRIKINFKGLLIGFFLASIFALPYIFFELSSTPFCRDCQAFMIYQNIPRRFESENFIRSLQILNGSYFQYLLGQDYNEFLNSNRLLTPINYIFTAEFSVIIISLFYFGFRKRDYLYLPIIVLLVSFLFFITKTTSFIHYFVILLPVVCLIYGIIFYELYHLRESRFYKIIAVSVFLLFFISKFFFMFQFFQYISQKQDISGDYGPVFKLTRENLNKNILQYILLPNYSEIEKYGYIFINTSIFHQKPAFHQKMGDYFAYKTMPRYAISEYQQAIRDDPKDIYSYVNLINQYLITNQIDETNKTLELLSTLDGTSAAKIKQYISEKQ